VLSDRVAAFVLKLLLRMLNLLSLAGAQRLGKFVGDVVFFARGRLRKTTLTNLRLSFPNLSGREAERVARSSLRHTGCFAAESGVIWSRDERWKRLLVATEGVEMIDRARRHGKGVLLLAPHFGNWEILNLFLGTHCGLTALYDPPRVPGLDQIVREGRARTGSVLLPATTGGIRNLYAALKSGGVVGLLPDQVPGTAAGEYAPFFGRPALTMTLAYRLVAKLRPSVMMAHARRLPHATGFSLGFEALPQLETCTSQGEFLARMNGAIERLVLTDKAQYQWEYKRFKGPKHAPEKIY
jgi:Kdo2-lipid IVA lauroyltransferase/acyltransferase